MYSSSCTKSNDELAAADVCIVVPIHNSSVTLGTCIRSLLAQTYENCEIVLVENGSTDETPLLARNMAGKYSNIRYLEIEEADVTLARFAGVGATDCKWISFCDADDWYEPNAISKMLQAAVQSNADIVDAGYKKRISPFTPSLKKFIPKDYEHMRSDWVIPWCNPIRYSLFSGLCGSLYNREVCFSDIPAPVIQSGLRRGEDIIINAIAHSRSSRTATLEDAVYSYRIGGVTSSNYKLIDDLAARSELMKQYVIPDDLSDSPQVGYELAAYALKVIEMRYQASWDENLEDIELFYTSVLMNDELRQLCSTVLEYPHSTKEEKNYASMILSGDLSCLMKYERKKYSGKRILLKAIGKTAQSLRGAER